MTAQPSRDDLADATLVADVANARCRWREACGGKLSNLKLFRETVWLYWEHPRLPRPLIRSKYPATVPWSPAARAAFHADPKTKELVIEHSRPVEQLLQHLLDAAPLMAEAAVEILRWPSAHAVVTDAEHKALGNAAWYESDPLCEVRGRRHGRQRLRAAERRAVGGCQETAPSPTRRPAERISGRRPGIEGRCHVARMVAACCFVHLAGRSSII